VGTGLRAGLQGGVGGARGGEMAAGEMILSIRPMTGAGVYRLELARLMGLTLRTG
jgi:hypothetical protein